MPNEQKTQTNRDTFKIRAYDKDNDNYYDLTEPFSTFTAAQDELEKIVLKHRLNELRAPNGEPYDWFEIYNTNTPDEKLFIMG